MEAYYSTRQPFLILPHFHEKSYTNDSWQLIVSYDIYENLELQHSQLNYNMNVV